MPTVKVDLNKPVFFDIETYPNYTLFAFKLGWTGKVVTHEIYGKKTCLRPDQREQIRAILTKYTTVGFNSLNFDIPLTTYALAGKSAYEIYQACEYIIKGANIRAWMFYKHFDLRELSVKHVDLIEPAPGVMTSLKLYGARLHSKTLWDLPTKPGTTLDKPQCREMRDYCVNDLNTTEDLYHGIREALELRIEMSEQYGVDLMSKSDAQIAEAVLVSELGFSSKPKPQNVSSSDRFEYQMPEWVKGFSSPVMREAVSIIKSHKFQVDNSGKVKLPPELRGLKIPIGDSVYQMGIGGLHSTERRRMVSPSDGEVLIDKDVTSYYPATILGQRLYPYALGEKFLDVYKSIVDRRIAAKTSGDMATSDSLKIVINGSFGKFGSKYSCLYDPKLLIQVTLTGQLALLLLIETLEAHSCYSVVSANTDGFVTLIGRDDYGWYEEICMHWEETTGFNLEATEYKGLYSRDVNSYFGATMGGGDKSIGAFRSYDTLKLNPTFQIVAIAAKKFLTDGTPIGETVRGCTDVRQFLSARTVKGGALFDTHLAEKPVYKVAGVKYKTVASSDRNAEKNNCMAVMSYPGGEASWNRKLLGTKLNKKGETVPRFDNIYVSGGTYLGKVVRWYHSTKGGTMHYVSNGNKVPQTDGSMHLMTLPADNAVPADLDHDRYISEAIDMVDGVGYFDDI
jgi:hypothetical protein